LEQKCSVLFASSSEQWQTSGESSPLAILLVISSAVLAMSTKVWHRSLVASQVKVPEFNIGCVQAQAQSQDLITILGTVPEISRQPKDPA
jgi:hypothetical protein